MTETSAGTRVRTSVASAKVRELLAKQMLHVSVQMPAGGPVVNLAAAYKDGDRLTEDVGMTSLDLYSVLLSIEEQFGIAIPDEAASTVKTVAELVALADLVGR